MKMKHPCGIQPTIYCILIKPHESDRLVGKLKTIIAPDETKERADGAMKRGEIVAISPLAFNFTKWPDGAQIPKVGDVVLFRRYSADRVEGADGVNYWMIEDKHLQAVLDPDVWNFVKEDAHAAA